MVDCGKENKIYFRSIFLSPSFRADVNNLAFDFKILLPQLNFTGKYALKIKILLLDISGKGNVRGVLSELMMVCIFSIDD